MKTVLLIILFLFLIVAFAIFIVDFVFFLKDRYCRFHIGRWDNFNLWCDKIKKVCEKWVINTPTIRKFDNSRYLLLDILQGKYRSSSIQSWQTAALMLGLFESNDEKIINQILTQYISKDGNWINKPIAVDSSMLSYAILKCVKNPYEIKPAMDFMIKIVEQNIDENGLISYTRGKNNPDRYVDTLGLVCPFLMLYSKTYNISYYSNLAYKQLEFYYNYGLLKDTYLPNHAIDANTKLPLGVYGWGRGTAWYILGLLDTYLEMDDCSEKIVLKGWIENSINSYYKFQFSDGGFGSIIQNKNTYDSSATATLAYFYLKWYSLYGNLKHKEVAERCLRKLLSVTRITGAIDWCQGDTKGIGIFSQIYDIMPFCQGMTLRAINLLKEELNGN